MRFLKKSPLYYLAVHNLPTVVVVRLIKYTLHLVQNAFCIEVSFACAGEIPLQFQERARLLHHLPVPM